MNEISSQSPSTKPTLVIGLGMTGFSVVRYLRAQGRDVVVADSREAPPYLAEFERFYPDGSLILGQIPYDRFDDYEAVVVSPGVEVPQGYQCMGDIEVFAQSVDAPVIAITGSNGKSTVTMLVSVMLEAGGYHVKTGGNIGTPALDLLDGIPPDFYVLELSSFQLDTTGSLTCRSSVVLNISEDHMDRYGSLEEYANSKYGIYRGADVAVVNLDETTPAFATEDANKVIGFSLSPLDTTDDFSVLVEDGIRGVGRGGNWIESVDKMTMKGDQNIANLLAAMALIQGAGVELDGVMMDAALAYPGLPHRCERVLEQDGVVWINDSKGTNVGATIAAISGLESTAVLIAGGIGKDADFSPLADALKNKVDQVILLGRDAKKIEAAIKDVTVIQHANSLKQAIEMAREVARPGQVVLFSPACSSYDMFESYEHRGDEFRALVRELIHGG